MDKDEVRGVANIAESHEVVVLRVIRIVGCVDSDRPKIDQPALAGGVTARDHNPNPRSVTRCWHGFSFPRCDVRSCWASWDSRKGELPQEARQPKRYNWLISDFAFAINSSSPDPIAFAMSLARSLSTKGSFDSTTSSSPFTKRVSLSLSGADCSFLANSSASILALSSASILACSFLANSSASARSLAFSWYILSFS